MTQIGAEQQYTRLGAADFGPGEMRDFQVAGHSILVANYNGTFLAIEDRCSHDNGPLAEGRLRGCEVECPRHQARFDLRDGKAVEFPAFNPVASYPLRVVDGQIEVQLVERPPERYEDPPGMDGYNFFST